MPVAGLVVWVEGADNFFTMWNLLPLLVAWVVARRPMGRPADGLVQQWVFAPVAGFVAATVIVIAVAHLAWLFGWGGTAPGHRHRHCCS